MNWFRVRSKLNWSSCRGHAKLTCFWSGDRNLFDFSVGMEINLVLFGG